MAGRRRREGAAGTIAERYPDVEVVEFQLTFVDDESSLGRPLTRIHRREPKHSALFRFDCPSRCVGGGFDLDGPVHAMLRAGEHRTEGRIPCLGWQEGLRRGHRCRCELRYVAWADHRHEPGDR